MSELKVKSAATTLGGLVAEINEEHRLCEEALKTGLRHALRAGELLIEARRQCPHGAWGTWLEENFAGSERTAQAYMKVAREVPKLEGAKAQRVADLGLRGALRELSAPAVETDEAEHDAGAETFAAVIRDFIDDTPFCVFEEEQSLIDRRLDEECGPQEEALCGRLLDLTREMLVEQLKVGVWIGVPEEAPEWMIVSNRDSGGETRICARPGIPYEDLRRLFASLGRIRFRVRRELERWVLGVVAAAGDPELMGQRVRKEADNLEWAIGEKASALLEQEDTAGLLELAKSNRMTMKEAREHASVWDRFYGPDEKWLKEEHAIYTFLWVRYGAIAHAVQKKEPKRLEEFAAAVEAPVELVRSQAQAYEKHTTNPKIVDAYQQGLAIMKERGAV